MSHLVLVYVSEARRQLPFDPFERLQDVLLLRGVVRCRRGSRSGCHHGGFFQPLEGDAGRVVHRGEPAEVEGIFHVELGPRLLPGNVATNEVPDVEAVHLLESIEGLGCLDEISFIRSAPMSVPHSSKFIQCSWNFVEKNSYGMAVFGRQLLFLLLFPSLEENMQVKARVWGKYLVDII